MKRRSVAGALLLLGVGFSLPAQEVNFPTAFKAYTEGRYGEARTQFLQLAQLGHAASQYDLGAMAMRGQGGPKDFGAAVGWLTAAAENGDTQLSPEKLAAARARLNGEQLKVAEEIAGRYGRAGLLNTVLPVPRANANCPDVVMARLLHAGASSQAYPLSNRRQAEEGFVVLQVSIGLDGVARDPEVLMAVPSSDFLPSAVQIAMSSRYQPAMRSGAAIESKLTVKFQYLMNGGWLWDMPNLKKLRELAADGVPSAEYVVGLAATLDSSLRTSPEEAQALLLAAAQGGDARAQYWAANRFMSLGACQQTNKMLPWLQAAAAGGDGAAQLALAMQLLRDTPSAELVAQARSLLQQASGSDDFYVLTHVTALLAASPLEAVRDPARARIAAEKLAKSPLHSDPQLQEAIAAAWAAGGDFRTAVKHQQTACDEAKRLGWVNVAAMQERLAAYGASKPWIGDLFAVRPESAPTSAPAGR